MHLDSSCCFYGAHNTWAARFWGLEEKVFKWIHRSLIFLHYGKATPFPSPGIFHRWWVFHWHGNVDSLPLEKVVFSLCVLQLNDFSTEVLEELVGRSSPQVKGWGGSENKCVGGDFLRVPSSRLGLCAGQPRYSLCECHPVGQGSPGLPSLLLQAKPTLSHSEPLPRLCRRSFPGVSARGGEGYPWHHTSPFSSCSFYFYFHRLYFLSTFWFIVKLTRKWSQLLHAQPTLHIHTQQPPPYYPHSSPEGMFFTIDEPPLTNHNHPRFMLGIRVHSWCYMFYQLWQMYIEL